MTFLNLSADQVGIRIIRSTSLQTLCSLFTTPSFLPKIAPGKRRMRTGGPTSKPRPGGAPNDAFGLPGRVLPARSYVAAFCLDCQVQGCLATSSRNNEEPISHFFFFRSTNLMEFIARVGILI